MRTGIAIVVAVGVGVLGLGSVASGAKEPRTVKFSAALNIGQEVPHPKGVAAGASGHFSASLSGTSLKWTLSFAHLSGPATAAHIHMAPRGKSGAVIVPFCGPCKSPVSGTATVTAHQISAMEKGQTYVNVHTAKNPNGEIRGQITRAM